MAGLRIERRLLLPRQRAKCRVGVNRVVSVTNRRADAPDTLSAQHENLCDDYHSGHEPRLVPLRAQSEAGETNGKF